LGHRFTTAQKRRGRAGEEIDETDLVECKVDKEETETMHMPCICLGLQLSKFECSPTPKDIEMHKISNYYV
jgi:hypothetical protein